VKKKTMILAVCLLLVGLLAVNGTLAQGIERIFQTLSGTNAPVQNETLLQVKLVHQVRNAQGNALVEGSAPQTLVPVGYPSDFHWENSKVTTRVGVAAYELWDASMMDGALDKFTAVKNVNTGAEAKHACFRLAFAVDANIFDKLKLNFNTTEESFVWEEDWRDIVIGSRPFKMMVATYTETLEPGGVSPPALLQVAMDKSATNEDYARIGSDFLQVKVMAVDADALVTDEQTLRPCAEETLNATIPLNDGFNPF